MGWTAKVKDSVSYAAMTTVTDALAYRIDWLMNRPAKCTLLMNDDSGANTQTYGAAYMGTSAILIEQPTATEIFRGRIIAAEPDVQAGTLTLRGEDWLGQLNDRLINYDTREDLGNNYREYTMTPYFRSSTYKNCVHHIAPGDGHLYISTQELGNWSNDQFNTMHLIIPSKYLGKMVEVIHAYDETVTVAEEALDNDAPVSGETNTWKTDSVYHQMDTTSAGGRSPDFHVEYDFHTLAADSTLVDTFDTLTLTVAFRAYGADLDRCHIYVYNHTRAAYLKVWEIYTANAGTAAMGEDITLTIDITNVYDQTDYGTQLISDWMSAAGELDVKIAMNMPAGGANGTLNLRIDELYFTLGYTVDTAPSSGYLDSVIDDTFNSANSYNKLDLDASLAAGDIIDDWPFHITDKLTVYVADIIDTYDELYALDSTSNITASSLYYGRHYHMMRPLDILNDLRIQDGTDFWLEAWDGDSLDVVWNSSYGVGGAPTWTDSSVLSWITPRQSLEDVINEYLVEGFTFQETKVTGSDTDAGSITAYGRRSELINDPDVGSDHEADQLAGAAVDRTHDLPFHVSALLDGYSTVVLGDVVIVNSTKLGLANQNYVVTRKIYDSEPATTTFFLTPHAAMLNIESHLDLMMHRLNEKYIRLQSGQERASRYTSIWS